MRLTDLPTLRALLARHGVDARKSLGQHFLTSQRVVDAIVAAVQPCAGVLEIGPGPGVLTGPLSEAAHLVALEVDERMVPVLAESAPRAEVRLADALKVPLADVLAPLPEPRAVVSNLPYYITGPLLRAIADVRAGFSVAVLMMQREVADRILAAPGASSRGALSVCLQRQFEVARVCTVPAGSFSPPPKVDSSVLRLVPRAGPVPEGWEHAVHRAFAQPRKTLANNLRAAGWSPDRIAAALARGGLEANVRPHLLTEEQWNQVLA